MRRREVRDEVSWGWCFSPREVSYVKAQREGLINDYVLIFLKLHVYIGEVLICRDQWRIQRGARGGGSPPYRRTEGRFFFFFN